MLFFRPGFFWEREREREREREKKRAFYVEILLLTELPFKMKLNFGAKNKADVLQMLFMMIWFKYFNDNLNILLILSPSCESFSGKCA